MQKEEQRKIDDAEPLSEEEIQEKESLLSQGIIFFIFYKIIKLVICDFKCISIYIQFDLLPLLNYCDI